MPSRPIRVMLVSTMLDRGGAERVTSTLLQHFDRSRIMPSLGLLRPQIGYSLPSDVRVHHLGYRGIWSFLGAARRLRLLVEQEKPDIVLGNVNATNLLAGFALRRSRHRAIWVARIGNNPRFNDAGARRIIARRVYPDAALFVVNSRGLVGAMEACYPFTRDRIDVLPNPTDFAAIDDLSHPEPHVSRHGTRPVLISVGRLAKAKRFDLLLEVLLQVQRELQVEWWVCGDGPERGRLERRARQLGVEGAVRWLGHCRNPFSLMSRADLFLLSSDYEGLPNALIEAQGLGLPAISTNCPYGPDEIIEHGVTGLLTPVGDERAMSEAILKLLQAPVLRQRMGEAAKRRARRLFDVGPITRQWEDVIVRAISSNPRASRLTAKSLP